MVTHKKGQVWNKAKTAKMLEFEKETSKNAVYNGKITGGFEYWLWQKEKKLKAKSKSKPKPKPKAKPKPKPSVDYNYDKHIESFNLDWQLEDKIKSFVFKTYKWEKIDEEIVRLSINYWKFRYAQDSVIEKHKVNEIEAKNNIKNIEKEIENYLNTHPSKKIHWIIGGNCLF